MSQPYTHSDGRTVYLHFGSWLPKIMGPRSINLGVTPSAKHIHFKQKWVRGKHLAHEYAHTLDAERLGWRYLPWIAWNFVKVGFKHDASKAEIKADAYAEAHGHEFPDFGNVPSWVA